MSEIEHLELAVQRLLAFRHSLSGDAVIHRASSLTAADLDIVLKRLRETRDAVMIPEGDLGAATALDRILPRREYLDR